MGTTSHGTGLEKTLWNGIVAVFCKEDSLMTPNKGVEVYETQTTIKISRLLL